MTPALALARPGVAGLAALCALAAQVAAVGRLDAGGVVVAACVALTAAGALALNQVQECMADALMLRTRSRPLPAGRLRPAVAGAIAIGLLAAGLAGLAAAAGLLPAAIAGLAVAVYNGVYTPLKRRTPFAALAGTLAGGAIPVIGWTAGGGGLDGRPLWWLTAFLVVWQVPHTWLLLLSTPGDYERAGFVPPTRGLGPRQVRRVMLAWTAAAVVACAVMPAFGVLRRPAPWIACLAAGVWMIARLVRALAVPAGDPASMRRAFDAANLLALTALLAIVADRA